VILVCELKALSWFAAAILLSTVTPTELVVLVMYAKSNTELALVPPMNLYK